MSVDYLRGSLRRVDEKTIQFRLVNRIGSGSADVGIKVLLDGKDSTAWSTITRGNEGARPVKPSMEISSNYGDEFLVKVRSNTQIEPGPHKVEVNFYIGYLGSFTAKFEGTL